MSGTNGIGTEQTIFHVYVSNGAVNWKTGAGVSMGQALMILVQATEDLREKLYHANAEQAKAPSIVRVPAGVKLK